MLGKFLKPDLIMLNPFMRIYYKFKYGADGIVYMLHRVGRINKNGIPYNENLKVSPEWLEFIIISYQKQGFNFISLDDLYLYLKNKKSIKKPFIAFTLDDGYIDNYTEAYPIFKKHQVPFCIYIATDFPDNKAFLWWYLLEDYLKDTPQKNIEFIKFRREILQMPKDCFEDNIKKLLGDYNYDPAAYIKDSALTWNMIKEMAQDPLCTIGGHSVTHPAFNSLTENEIRYEIEIGINKLEQNVGKKIEHFAYPYGSLQEVGTNEYRITESYGFKTIATTINESISQNTNSLRIPRFMLYEPKH